MKRFRKDIFLENLRETDKIATVFLLITEDFDVKTLPMPLSFGNLEGMWKLSGLLIRLDTDMCLTWNWFPEVARTCGPCVRAHICVNSGAIRLFPYSRSRKQLSPDLVQHKKITET